MTGQPMLRELDRTLRMAALELAELATIAENLEFTAEMFGRELDDALMARCQLADLLTQRLAGLTSFVAALADRASPSTVLDVREAVEGLRLSDQARRLSGVSHAMEAPALAGDLSLF